ncbi:nucleotide triphosphate diphosphatase NUDT15-like [Glandiceps talaboti]
MAAPSSESVIRTRPKVGVGVVITSPHYPGCVLIGRRNGKIPGTGLYALPGGHLEFGETWEECARRETLEETGLELEDSHFAFVINAVMADKDYHYITLFVKSQVDTSKKCEPENLEPEKCQGWEWTKWDNFPPEDQLFHPLLVARKQGFEPFESIEKNALRI